jgi:FtsP/CotA-like multicopper oxidase with cupredoxin domain
LIGFALLSATSRPTAAQDKKGGGDGGGPTSPTSEVDTPPFAVTLPELTEKVLAGSNPFNPPKTSTVQAVPVDVSTLNPAPNGTVDPNNPKSDSMQLVKQFPPARYYQIDIKEGEQEFHPALTAAAGKKTKIWGYNGTFPGPTFVSRYGSPALVRVRNQVAVTNTLFGLPTFATHLHNGHTAAESDGNPAHSAVTGLSPIIGTNGIRDYHYAMFRAGLVPGTKDGDPAETLATLWYHDHRESATALHVYAGLAGFHLFFDDADTGDETKGLRLPSFPFDVPLMFADKAFKKDAQMILPQLNTTDGFLGDRFTVNGKIQPTFSVQKRKYRFRLLNSGPSRFYSFFLINEKGENQHFQQIGSDESLLEAPIDKPEPAAQQPDPLRQGVFLGVAERADIVIDFAKFAGKKLYLVNRLDMDPSGRGPRNNTLLPIDLDKKTNLILQFTLDQAPTKPDMSQVPATLRKPPPLPTPNELKKMKQRHFQFIRGNGGPWEVQVDNDPPRPFDSNNGPQVTVPAGSKEVWVLVNGGGGGNDGPIPPTHISKSSGFSAWVAASRAEAPSTGFLTALSPRARATIRFHSTRFP